ncbi:hypothetical protein CTAYLR_003822 [Chrysophaeum taylorii]|uniref:Actin n=1 Tax=Chrysophaeum taylorii TaxID=2483200 RepID=A0AAD7XLS3_9STRA|nr:hypothetical protein CTAYLR_003822 [Chrysophaeum taylorii]
MAVAIGGDETGAIVGDVGHLVSKFGFAGEDAPKCVVASTLGRNGPLPEFRPIDISDPKSYESEYTPSDIARPTYSEIVLPTNTEPATPLRDGDFDDWCVVEELWARAVARMKVDARNHPVLAAIPSWTTSQSQEKYLEMIFETFDTPAAYLSRSAALAAFSIGRSSALVVDCGAGTTSAAPVVDGYVLLKATRRSSFGGNFLDAKVLEKLEEVVPRCVVRERCRGRDVDLGPLRRYAELEVAREVKESLSSGPIELPDGTTIDPTEFQEVPDHLFTVDDGLPSLLRAALERSDVDVRKDLLQSVVLTGGGSLFPGLADRLQHELSSRLASSFKTKILSASSIERRFSVWIGGSILASLGSFQQMWLSRAEYMEDGPLAAQERWN